MSSKTHQLQQNCRIILASTSEVRKKILQECHLKFEVVAPFFNEEEAKKDLGLLSIKQRAMFLAKNKALSVSKDPKYKDCYVIGSDQICQFGDLELEKSKDHKESFQYLKQLSNNTHYQNNAVYVYKNAKLVFKKFSKVKLKMRQLLDAEIEAYISLDNSFNSAGGYKFESLGKHLFVEVNGDQYSIMGLNAIALLNFLHQNLLISFI
jgi:septum formation protein